MVPRSGPKATLGASWFEVAKKGATSFHVLCFFWAFWRHLGDFGRHFGPSWAPRGSQNRAFWNQDALKCRKMRLRMRHKKKHEFLIEFRSKNVRFWRCWTHRNALYISISVVFADDDKIENFMKIDAQMNPKSHPQIAVWAIKGPTFEVFGRVLRNAIFDDFWGVPKSTKNDKSSTLGRPKWKRRRISGVLGRVLGRFGTDFGRTVWHA